jgi:hypothetical protein
VTQPRSVVQTVYLATLKVFLMLQDVRIAMQGRKAWASDLRPPAYDAPKARMG